MNHFWRGLSVIVFLALGLLAFRSSTHSIDFPVYHRAARQLIAGNYALYPDEVYAGRPVPSQGFRYAPAIAVLFLPFGWLPLRAAALAFFGLKLLALWWVGDVVTRRAGLTGWGRDAYVAALVVVGGYLAEELRFGNAHFFCVALMVLAFDRAESGQTVRPALALAVAILTKLTPLALLLYFGVQKRFRLCAATIAFVLLLLALPALVIGPTANARELRAFATYATEKVDEVDNYSLRGALVRYLRAGVPDVSHVEANVANLPMPVITVLWGLGLLILGLGALAAVRHDEGDPVARLLEFCLVLTGIILASPHTQRRYYVALYVPAVLLLALLPTSPRGRDRRTIIIGLVAIAGPGTILPMLFGGRWLSLRYEAASPYFFGALVLYGVLVAMTLRRKASRPPTALG